MPRTDNRITLSSTLKATNGLPVAYVNSEEHPHDVALRRHAQRQGQRIYEAAGAKRVVFSSTPPATHQMGTARMSADPALGVTNPYGRTR